MSEIAPTFCKLAEVGMALACVSRRFPSHVGPFALHVAQCSLAVQRRRWATRPEVSLPSHGLIVAGRTENVK